MQRFRIIIVGLVTLGLGMGCLINSYWRFDPNFFYLDTFFGSALYFQIALVLISLVLGVLLYIKRGGLKFWLPYIVTIIFSMASWYQVGLSSRTNNFRITLLPIYYKEVEYQDVKTLIREKHRVLIRTASKSHSIFTGVYPFGPDSNALWTKLSLYHNCIRKSDNGCVEYEFVFP